MARRRQRPVTRWLRSLNASRPGGKAAGGTRPRAPVILEFPGKGDSYSECFCAALEAAGARVMQADYSGRWLLRHLGRADFAHFHWPSFYYAGASAPAVLARAAKFAAVLALMRMSGVRILWTAHNLYPHERSSPHWIDRAVRRLIVGMSHRVFVHGPTAGGVLQRELGVDAARLVPIVHGHFVGHYPMHATQAEARRRLRLPAGKRVFTFIGACRPYKNVTGLVAAFQQHFDDEWLVIAGRCPDKAYRAELERLIGSSPDRILFVPEFIADNELQFFVRAADAVVLPFRDILTSGSAVLALSFGRPVVAPRLGHLVDVVNDGAGVLYDVNDPEGLAHGMRAVLSRRFDQEQIVRHISSLRWQDAAATVLAALQGAN